MSRITIDRCGNAIVNRGGKAHHTGWVVLGTGVGDTPRLARGTGGMVKRGNSISFRTSAQGQEIPVTLPLSVEDFERLTGWHPAA